MISLKKQTNAILFLIAFSATMQVGNTFGIARMNKAVEDFEPVIVEPVQYVEPDTSNIEQLEMTVGQLKTTIEQLEMKIEELTVEETIEETSEEPIEETTVLPTIDCALDEETQNMIYEKCVEYDVEFPLVMAVIFRESSFRPNIISETGDYGLMQINSVNHGWLSEELGLTDFLDPDQNTTAGIYMLSDLFNKYDDPAKVLMAYNMGEGGAGKLWKQGVYTSSYAESILQQTEIYSKQIEERMG